MTALYVGLYALAIVLMVLGLWVPAIVFAAAAHSLAYRSARTPRNPRVVHVYLPKG